MKNMHFMKMPVLVAGSLCGVVSNLAGAANAWPAKAITMVVPFRPAASPIPWRVPWPRPWNAT